MLKLAIGFVENPFDIRASISRIKFMPTFARSAGVDFASIDGEPTRLFFLLVVPEQSGGQHLKALARISRFFRDDEFRTKLNEAASLDDIFRAIEEEDAKF